MLSGKGTIALANGLARMGANELPGWSQRDRPGDAKWLSATVSDLLHSKSFFFHDVRESVIL